MCIHPGIEHLMADYVNCLQAFAVRFKLKVSREFLALSRLFPNAVEIPDWNHQMAGALKAALSVSPSWPQKLVWLRAWCRFFKDDSHREAVATYLVTIGQSQLADLLKSFTASFAKWRYHSPTIIHSQL